MTQKDFHKKVEHNIQVIKSNTRLGRDAFHLRNIMAESGFEVTPDEMHEALAEAAVRIGRGSCQFCGSKDKELRYGMCFKCFMKDK